MLRYVSSEIAVSIMHSMHCVAYLRVCLCRQWHIMAQCCIMTVWIVRKATVGYMVTVARSNTGYEVTEYKNLRAIYGHLSHRDDVTNYCRGSPFICRNIKTEWVCVPLSHKDRQQGMPIVGRVASRETEAGLVKWCETKLEEEASYAMIITTR